MPAPPAPAAGSILDQLGDRRALRDQWGDRRALRDQWGGILYYMFVGWVVDPGTYNN